MKKLMMLGVIALMSLNMKAQYYSTEPQTGDSFVYHKNVLDTVTSHGKKNQIKILSTKKYEHQKHVNGGKKNIWMAEEEPLEFLGCLAATNLFVAVQYNQYCVWASAWIPGGGTCLALNTNGTWYKDPNTGYGLFSPAVNGISTTKMPIATNEVFKTFVRTFTYSDTTNAVANGDYCDTPVNIYTVPSTWVSCDYSGGSSTTTPATIVVKKKH